MAIVVVLSKIGREFGGWLLSRRKRVLRSQGWEMRCRQRARLRLRGGQDRSAVAAVTSHELDFAAADADVREHAIVQPRELMHGATESPPGRERAKLASERLRDAAPPYSVHPWMNW
ncbi:MAG TPA: hypothetical protein VKE26_18505 [Xanthobacteraceae bacterium]|nr:hypothetical protein [Xanthobacteraceae bacterium]